MSADEGYADLLMLAHVSYSLFVLLGLMLLLMGTVLGWRWTRARSFRITHLAATLFLGVRVWTGMPCPFSAAEDALRNRITTPCPFGGEIHNLFHRCAFRGTDPRYFTGCTALFGILTLAAFALNEDRRAKHQTAGTS